MTSLPLTRSRVSLRKLIYFLAITNTCLSVYAQDSTTVASWIGFQGYLKDLQGIYFVDDLSSLSSSNLIHNRLSFQFNFSPSFSGRLDLRNRIFWGDQLQLIPGFSKIIDNDNGLVDMSYVWVDEKNFIIHSMIDRAFIQYSSGQWNMRFGRQRINWGLNTIWNPNDIFNAYNFLDFDYEERPGNDAIQVQHFFRNNSSAEVAVRPGERKDESVAALLYRFNTSKYDFQVLGGIYYSDFILGGGWAGNIKEAGFKGEVSYFHPKHIIGDTPGSISLSVMADQTFKGNWYVSVSFLYNSNPISLPVTASGIYSQDLSAKNLFPYEFTYYAGAVKSLTPITVLSAAIIYSPTNNNLILFPSFSWNVANNFDVGLIVQSAFSRIQDRYRTQGNNIFIRSKWSF